MTKRRQTRPKHVALRSRRRILLGGVAATVVTIFVLVLALTPMTAGRQDLDRVPRDHLALEMQVTTVQGMLIDWQGFIEPQFVVLQRVGSVISTADVATGASLVAVRTQQVRTLVASLRARGLTSIAGELEAGDSRLAAAIAKLAPLLVGHALTTDRVDLLFAGERGAYVRMWNVTTKADTQLGERTAATLLRAQAHFDRTHLIIVAVGIASVLLMLCETIVLGIRAGRRERKQNADTRQRDFERSLQRALEMSKTEDAVYEIVATALRDAVPQLEVELLVADSSRAHFRHALSTSRDPVGARGGCGVVSPLDCPATTAGHTIIFRSSGTLDACPHLKGRPTGACSAVCAPVSFGGRTIGVAHATGEDGVEPARIDVDYVELTSRKAAERLAMLRAFEESEGQARTDPLTGSLNRRSIENAVRDLQHDGVPYVVAYGDLDHFKILNDVHGHGAGDQALRLFARVVRDSVRPHDLAARYGGEEFVIVLPDCPEEVAVTVLERIRERLALALAAAQIPAFTVSFGLAASHHNSTYKETLSLADGALMNAKTAGRNRIVRADRSAATSQLGRLTAAVAHDEGARTGIVAD